MGTFKNKLLQFFYTPEKKKKKHNFDGAKCFSEIDSFLNKKLSKSKKKDDKKND